jgi:serine/threonine protein kinase
MPVLKIGDLGLVTEAKNAEYCYGTPGFTAPEYNQVCKTDLFAIGKTMYFIITGSMLDEKSEGKVTQIRPGIRKIVISSFLSNKIANIIAKLTINDPARRYLNAAKAKSDILNVFDDEEHIIYYDAMLKLNTPHNISEITDELFKIVKPYCDWQKISPERRTSIQNKVKEYQRIGLIKRDGHQYSLA